MTAVRSEADVAVAVTAIARLETVDAAIIRRTLRPGRPDVLGELLPEYHVFRKIGTRFLSSFAFEGGRAVQPLLAAIAVLRGIGGDRRKPLPADVPLGHLERRWSRHVFPDNSIDRSYYELATYFILTDALASGGVWVATSRIHRPLEQFLTPASPATPALPVASVQAFNVENYLADRMAALDAALLNSARRWRSKSSAKPFPNQTQKTDIAADLVAEGRFPMKTVAETLGVSRSNLVERLKGRSKPRGSYHKAEDAELLPAIRRLVDQRPTYGYRRIAALFNRERRTADKPVANTKRVRLTTSCC